MIFIAKMTKAVVLSMSAVYFACRKLKARVLSFVRLLWGGGKHHYVLLYSF